jgi:hypothetical protein
VSFPFPVHTIDAESGFERGLQHGTLARDQVAVSLDTYQKLFRDFVRIEWAEAKAMGESYGEMISAFDSQLFDEIRGVAEGSGFELAEILALNARSEIALSVRMVDGCTALRRSRAQPSMGRRSSARTGTGVRRNAMPSSPWSSRGRACRRSPC